MFVCINHDLAEAKRAERRLVEAQKMEAVGQVAGGIARDFNNLPTVILGNAGLLAETGGDAEDRSLAEAIASAAFRGGELIARLLAFGRAQPPHPREIDVNAHVGGMRPLLRRTLREDIARTFSPDGDLPRAAADAGARLRPA